MTRASNKGLVAGRVVVASQSHAASAPGPASTSSVHTSAHVGTPASVESAARIASQAASLVERLGRDQARPYQSVMAEGEARAVVPERSSERTPRARDPRERSLELRIRAHLSRGELSVTLTDNRYTMISVRRENKGKHFKVRLHHMFADASPTITRALARYIAHNDRDASRVLGEYIDGHQERVRSTGRRAAPPRIITRGRFHDLREIFDDLNRRYFGGRIEARITWGQKIGLPKRRNSIKMGSYSVEDRLVRIHRSLDRAFVPRFFVEWVVYHEMLHQVHDIKVVNGRRQFHSREFLRDEARFEHYAAARSWERAHLDALLTC
jgi:hypothetical protein